MSSVTPDLVYNPVLDFVFREIKVSNKYDEIVVKAIQYFKVDMLTKANDELWLLAVMSTRSTEHVKPQYMVADLVRANRVCDNK